MKMQNFKFGEAVKFLANLAGMAPIGFQKLTSKEKKSGMNTPVYIQTMLITITMNY